MHRVDAGLREHPVPLRMVPARRGGRPDDRGFAASPPPCRIARSLHRAPL